MTTRFRDWLAAELLALGWSQRELARRAGVSNTNVSAVLNGDLSPTWDFCAAVAKPLGKNPVELFVLAGLMTTSAKNGLSGADYTVISDDERQLLEIFRSASVYDRDMLLRLANALVRQRSERPTG